MSRRVKRHRRTGIVVAAVVVLSISGAAILWARTRLTPDLMNSARLAYAQGDWDRSGSMAHQRLKSAPGDVQALRLAARVAARQDHDQRALAIYQRLRPGYLDAEDLFLKGRALNRAGDVFDASREFQAALARNPDHPEALAALAGVYLQSERPCAAEEVAERLSRQPNTEARAQVLLGTARAELQDPLGAAQALARWWQLDPEGRAVAPHPLASLRKLLARSWLLSGKPAEAKEVLDALVAEGPDPEAAWLLSRCFIQERDWKRAAAALAKLPSYRPANLLNREPAPFVGEARCAACHREQSDAVLASRHATTFSRARDLQDLALPEGELPDPRNPEVVHRLKRDGEALWVETRAGTNVWRAVVDYAFGSRDHLTTFTARDDRGRPFMVRISPYKSPRGAGWDIATGLPDSPADEEEYLGKKMFAGDGVRRCLGCHTTSAGAVIRDEGPEAADHSIGCERCHGPGAHHVAAVAAGFSDLAIVNPGDAPPGASDELCARCHGTQPPEGLNLPRTDASWLRFQSLTLRWSRCYTESDGTLSCVTCHDPHRNAETSAVRNEARCLSCHVPEDRITGARGAPEAASAVASTRPTALASDAAPVRAMTPCPVNPARGCIECHMPRIWVQGTHSFKTDHFIRVRDRDAAEARAGRK
jgi:tetratricopeptide (TPR) repeat protein